MDKMKPIWKYILTFGVTTVILCMILLNRTQTSNLFFEKDYQRPAYLTEPTITANDVKNIASDLNGNGEQNASEITELSQLNKLPLQQLNGLRRYLTPVWEEMETVS